MSKKKTKSKSKSWIYILVGIMVLIGALWMPLIQPMLRKSKAENDVAELALALKAYEGSFGGVPQGTIADICAALRGNNPHHDAIVEAYEMNTNHEFIDPWGTAYRLQPEARLRVYSFGPNKTDEQGKGDDIAAP